VTDPLLNSYEALLGSFPDLPTSPTILRAHAFAREHMPDFLFNHVTRSWIFAAKLGVRGGDQFDADVVGVSTLLHDIGMTPHGDGPHRFEVNGAEVARAFVRDLGFDDRRAQLVWDAVALHVTHSISLHKETEVALASRGIGVDFGVGDYASVAPEEIAAVLAMAPRLDMKRRFAACAVHLAETRPEATYDTFIRDYGERFVPGYAAPSWVDAIAGGPYSE
jgi:hypothetical protein